MFSLSFDQKVDILFGIFITALIAANVLGTKIATIFGISFSVGIFAYPITFLITDLIAEVCGKKKSRHLFVTGLVSLVVLFGLVSLSTLLPPADRYQNNDAYTSIFGTSLRIIVASIIAFGLSQWHDIWAFHFWKRKTEGKMLWLRNNLSTCVSQFVDTTVFMFIAFYQVTPEFDIQFIWGLILPYYGLKLIVALFDTPICYIGVKWLGDK